MFTYKYGRFHLGSSSFALPDNCLVDVLLPLDSHNGFLIRPLDHSFQIYLDYWTTGQENRCGLDIMVKEWTRPYNIRMEQYLCGTGWSIEYRDDRHFYRDLYLPMRESYLDDKENALNALGIDLSADTKDDLERAMQNRIYKDLLQSIVL